MADTERSIELETKIGFLEHTVETLNEVIVGQGRELEALTRRLALLEGRVQARGDDSGDEARDLADDRPPHY